MRYALDPPFTIGRSPNNGVEISDYHLSGEHLQLARLGTAVVARDLQSTNGSMLERGGQRIVLDASRDFQAELLVGDILRLGDARTPVTIRVTAISSHDVVGPAAALHQHARPQTDDDANDDQDAADRVIASRSIVDLPTILIALLTMALLWKFKKLPEPVIVVFAALLGLAIFPLLHR